MERKEVIRKLKGQIKILSAEQREAKVLLHMDHRKWGTDPRYQAFADKHKNKYGYFYVQSDILNRKVTITATLNFYNELRGKAYRHNVSEYGQCRYGVSLKKLHDEFVIVEQEEVEV